MTEYWNVDIRGRADTEGVRAFNSVLDNTIIIGTVRDDETLAVRVHKEAAADFAWGILENLGEAERPKPVIKVGDLVRHVDEHGYKSWGRVIHAYTTGGFAVMRYSGTVQYTQDAEALTVLTTEEFDTEVMDNIKENLNNA